MPRSFMIITPSASVFSRSSCTTVGTSVSRLVGVGASRARAGWIRRTRTRLPSRQKRREPPASRNGSRCSDGPVGAGAGEGTHGAERQGDQREARHLPGCGAEAEREAVEERIDALEERLAEIEAEREDVDERMGEIEADIAAIYAAGPPLAMVDSHRGITNLHVPSNVIIDASMPAAITSARATRPARPSRGSLCPATGAA